MENTGKSKKNVRERTREDDDEKSTSEYKDAPLDLLCTKKK